MILIIQRNFEFIYSPRTTTSQMMEKEEIMYEDLKKGFDPYTIKIIKKHYKEHLGKLNKETFVSILKRHLLTWHPNIENRTKILIKLLSRLFDEIDLNSNGDLEWEEFVNYIISGSYQQSKENSSYNLHYYSLSKEEFFDHQDEFDNVIYNSSVKKIENIITHCFYIRKFKLIGIVHEGKSRILFFNSVNNKKKSLVIDLAETQKEINKMEMKELNKKIIIKLEKERQHRIEIQNYYNNDNFNQLKILRNNDNNNNDINNNQTQEKQLNNEDKNKDNKDNNNNNNTEVKNKEIKKRKIYKIENEEEMGKNKNIKGLFALTTCFIDELNLLFISSSNNKISAWKYDYKTDEFKNVNFINYDKHVDSHLEKDNLYIPLFMANSPQNVLIYDHSLKCLYSGQENGKINKWEMNSSYPIFIFDIYEDKNKVLIENLSKKKTEDIDKSEEFFTLNNIKSMNNIFKRRDEEITRLKEELFKLEENSKSIASFKHKRDNISHLLLLDNMRLLCSSLLNGQIILWDIDIKRPIKVFTDQKTAIYSMVYDPWGNKIFTCGFEHEIFIYEPYNGENAVYKLKGHNSSISSLVIISKLNELISIDVLGIIKIWDTNTYVNFQTINTNDMLLYVQNKIKNKDKDNMNNFNNNKKKIVINNYLLTYNNPKKILVYGSKLLILEKGKEKNPNLTDDNQLLCCIYNNFSKSLITISSKRIKMWNILTGRIKKSYDNLMQDNEISAFTFDSQMKRLFLGDNAGLIKCFNLNTGDFIKNFFRHKNEIISIIHSTKNELLITCSSDLCVKFQDDKVLSTTDLIKEIYARPANYYKLDIIIKLKATVFDENNDLLIFGLSDGSIINYDVEHLKFFINPNEENKIRKKFNPISNICSLDVIDFIFFACENGKKYFMAKPMNKFYNFISNEKFGNFIGADDDDNKNQILSSSFNYKLYLLLTGDHFGNICCYDMKGFYDLVKKNNELKTEKEIIYNYKNNLNVYLKYKIHIHKDAIRYICVLEELNPKIIITTSNDKTVKLLELKTGQYIETLKQGSIKYNSVPIGIKFLKDNPFISKQEKDNKNKNDKNEFSIIYKKDITLPIKRPFINYDEANQKDIIKYFDKMMEFNAKIQLMSLSRVLKLSDDKSNNWNFNVNINHILKKNEEEIENLIKLVNKKEEETNKAEKLHQELSIFDPKYKPAFIENLDRNEKNVLKNQINTKIININFAMSKSETLRKEAETIENFIKKQNIKKIKEESYKNVLLKTIRPIKWAYNTKISGKSTTDTNKKILSFQLNKSKGKEVLKYIKLNKYNNHLFKSSSQPDIIHSNNKNKKIFKDIRFINCKNEFDLKFKELTTQFEFLKKKNKKYDILPKITKFNDFFNK